MFLFFLSYHQKVCVSLFTLRKKSLAQRQRRNIFKLLSALRGILFATLGAVLGAGLPGCDSKQHSHSTHEHSSCAYLHKAHPRVGLSTFHHGWEKHVRMIIITLKKKKKGSPSKSMVMFKEKTRGQPKNWQKTCPWV